MSFEATSEIPATTDGLGGEVELPRGQRSDLPSLTGVIPPLIHPSSVEVEVPLSVANVGPGFDHFGLALVGLCDRLELTRSKEEGFLVEGDTEIPDSWEANVAGIAARHLLRTYGNHESLHARLTKGFRGGSGLGSSGASAVAGALAAAALLSLDLGETRHIENVIGAALAGEAHASGARHLDNIAASLYGGFTFVERITPLRIHSLPPKIPVPVVVAVPTLRIPTRRARKVLPPTVPHRDAVENTAGASAVLLGWVRGDLELLGRNLVDRLAEPYRVPLLPGFAEARTRALRAGAYGVAFSGSGPAVFALAETGRQEQVREALTGAFRDRGIPCAGFVSRVGTGARLVRWKD